ncbi:hypothetical protein SNEBB_002441 [Seison nebaliae]|nr:hypothetical protein SNEBB_002441 [Seison nebaliae]
MQRSPNRRQSIVMSSLMPLLKWAQDVDEIKRSSYHWKRIFILLNELIEWKSNFAPFIIFLLISGIFGTIKEYELTVSSCILWCSLIFLNVDFLLLKLQNKFTDNGKKTNEREYTNFCERISHLGVYLLNFLMKQLELRQKKKQVFLLIWLTILVGSAFFCHIFHDFYITYFSILFLSFIPGIRQRNLFTTCKNRLRLLMSLD